MSKLNIGIIGVGKRGRILIEFINVIEEMSLAAIADISEESLDEAKKVSSDSPFSTRDYREVISMKGLDAVIIATPNYFHTEVSVQALEAGIPVYLEKPMATTLKDCDEIIAAEKQTGIPLMVGLHQRYDDYHVKMREIVDNGDIGEVKMIWYKEFRGPFKPGYEGWRLSKKRSGGTLVEKNVHHFDLFNWFSGSTVKYVSGFGGNNVIYGDTDILDNAVISLEYENQVRAGLALSLFSPGKGDDVGLSIVGEKGVVYKTEGEVVVKLPKQEVSYPVKPLYYNMGHGGREYNILREFIKFVKEGRKTPLDGLEGRKSVKVAIAAEKAVAERRTINMD